MKSIQSFMYLKTRKEFHIYLNFVLRLISLVNILLILKEILNRAENRTNESRLKELTNFIYIACQP